MNFTFGELNTTVAKKDQDRISSRILLHSEAKGRKRHILFLVEHPYPALVIKGLETWINREFANSYDYDIVSASLLEVSAEEIKKQGIYHFYSQNKSDYEQYLRPSQSIVVTFGSALSAVTLSPDLSYECFQDYVFNKTYFYSPALDANVFPIDGVLQLFKRDPPKKYFVLKDCSGVQFANRQFATVIGNYETLKNPSGVLRTRVIRLKTSQDWHDFYQTHNQEKRKVCWDLETSGLSYYHDRVGCITMSFDGITGYYMPWSIVDKEELSDFFKDRYQIGQNLKFDIKFLTYLGVRNLKADSDTLQLGHLLNEMRYNGLKSLAYYYTSHGGYDLTLEEYKDRYHPANYLEIPEGLLSEYATMDAIVNFQVHEAMQAQLTNLDRLFPPLHEGGWTMRQLYEQVKMSAYNNFIPIELRGIYVDMDKWDQSAELINSEILSLKDKLRESLGIVPDDAVLFSLIEEETEEEQKKDTLQSGKQLGELIESLGWECLGRTKQGWYNTGDEQLERWGQLGHPEAILIQRMRSYLTMQKTFLGKPNVPGTGWRRYVVKHPDGSYRIHPSYKSMMTNTMRNGCGDPNYQQLPSSSLGAEHMKSVISVPDLDKYYLTTIDYSGFQIKLATIDSEDPVLMKAFLANPDVDLHMKTGYNIFMKGVQFEVEEVHITDRGRKFIKFAHEEVQVRRNGVVMKVKAGELQETDSLV
jgi:DNA polymerase I-like protein with 3'-5' exonuclease and polymerase domains